MGDNATALKTIGVLVLLLIGLALAAIFSYNPIPNILIGNKSASPSATQEIICDNSDQTLITTCCQEWASNNQIILPACEGEWSWTQLGGCTFSCTIQ